MLGGPADSASSRLVEQANIRAEDTFSLAQFQHFRLHVWLYFHIDFGVCVRSTFFQHSGPALFAPRLCGVLGGAAFSLVFCCVVLPGLLLCVLLRFSSSFQWCRLPFPPLGGFSLLFSSVVLLGLHLLWVVVVWGVQCPDWCWGVLESMFSCLGSNNDENDTEE